VFDGVRAQAIVSSDHHDVLLLATVLGNGPDGFGLCRQLRAAGDRIPIILLGNGGDEADIVAGLEAGADDFMAKPVRLAELRSRIAALLRRQRYVRRIPPLRLGHVVLDHSARVVTCDAQPVPLTYTEYELLFLLICQRDRVLSREELLRAARGDATFTDPRSIDVYIRHLRLKLERDPSLPMLIQTVRGVGYKATQPSAATAHAGLAPTAGAAGFDKR
jgi:two-component system alkaline phosphatase synthesis response regulator PhoP